MLLQLVQVPQRASRFVASFASLISLLVDLSPVTFSGGVAGGSMPVSRAPIAERIKRGASFRRAKCRDESAKRREPFDTSS